MAEETQYDVFLSHNSQDKPAVEILARRLTDEAKLRPFLDKWHLVPGELWQEAIEEALDACQTVAVFLGPLRPRLVGERGDALGAFFTRAVLKHECHKGTNGTNLAGNDETTFVRFAHSCYS